ncbi:LamG-like jellyroll fold domain-containing protein, partial [bacterium]
MNKILIVLSVILICVLSIQSQDLSDLTLIAHYPLESHTNDVTSLQYRMTLTNIPFEDGGIYCNGIYAYDYDGCMAITPQLVNFSFAKLAISVTFKVTDTEEAAGRPLFIGGSSYRWLPVEFDADSLIGFGYNTDNTYTSNVWHTVTMTYDSLSDDALCYLDGVLVDNYNVQINHGNEKRIGITDFSDGDTFKGYLKDLKIYSIPPRVIEQDSLALAALYNSTDGANWIDNTNWLTGSIYEWFGVTAIEGR